MSERNETPKLSGQFSKALVYAECKHHNQVRKGSIGHDTLLVSVADKLDNARSMLGDYHVHGPSLWDRFNRKNPQDHLWYYESLLAAYRKYSLQSWMVDELDRVIGELKRLVEGGHRAVVV